MGCHQAYVDKGCLHTRPLQPWPVMLSLPSPPRSLSQELRLHSLPTPHPQGETPKQAPQPLLPLSPRNNVGERQEDPLEPLPQPLPGPAPESRPLTHS